MLKCRTIESLAFEHLTAIVRHFNIYEQDFHANLSILVNIRTEELIFHSQLSSV